MAKLTLPIPSPVPLHVLRSSIQERIAAIPPDGDFAWYNGNLETRLRTRCQDHGVGSVWMLATFSRHRFSSIKNVGEKTADFAEGVLTLIGLHFEIFESLTAALEQVKESFGHQWNNPRFPEILMALAGIGDWAKKPPIIAALAEHGLRPGMPLEELFVYTRAVTDSTEPKKLTVVEELLAFGALQAVDVLPVESMEDLPSGVTMIEVMMILAASEDWFGWGSVARDRFKEAARERLSPEAQKKIGIVEE